MIYKIKCNNIKCLSPLKSLTLLTSCGHIFCQKCSKTLKSIMKCSACQTLLVNTDIRIVDIDNIGSLIGHSPENIFEESRKSLAFWMYQMYEELEITKRMYEAKLQGTMAELEHLRSINSRYEMEREMMMQKIERLEKEVEREKCNVYEMDCKLGEKNKELQRISALNEKFKFNMRSMENNIN